MHGNGSGSMSGAIKCSSQLGKAAVDTNGRRSMAEECVENGEGPSCPSTQGTSSVTCGFLNEY